MHGFENAEDVTALGGALSYAGTAIAATHVGTYVITPQGLTSSNYAITFVNGELSINQAALTITATAQNKEYGATLTGTTGYTQFTTSGLQNGETVGSVTVAYANGHTAVAAVNTYLDAIALSAATGGTFTPANYAITYESGDLTVTTKALTITATNASKIQGTEYTFDQSAPSINFSVEGLINADAVTSVTLASAGSAMGAALGDYAIVVSDAIGTGLANYSISYTNGTLTVTDKIVLTISDLVVSNKVYDGSVTATVTNWGTLNGIVNGDDVSLDISSATAAFADKEAEVDKSVTLSTIHLQGADAAKYTLTIPVPTASITPRPLVLNTFVADSKSYDGLATVLSGAGFSDDRVGGDALQFAYDVAFEDALAGVDKAVEFTNIIINGGADATNYTLATTTGTAQASITPKALVVTANNVSKEYGSILAGGAEYANITIVGLVAGETAESVTVQYAGGHSPSAVVGVYADAIEISEITGGTFNVANYSVTYEFGDVTVTAKDITITATPQDKVYGTVLSNAAGYTAFSVTGIANAETVGSVSVNYISGHLGADATGLYAGAIQISLATGGSFVASNYNITYATGDLTVIAKDLTITANNQSKTYDGAIFPNGDYTVSYAGFENGEDAAALGGALSYTGTAMAATNVGTYVITPQGLTSSNYAITFVDGELSINQAQLTVTADNKTVTYGDAVPALTYTITGFVNGEDASVVSGAATLSTGYVATTAVAASPVSITPAQGTLSADNYSFTFVDGTVTINPKALTITAENKSKSYDGAVFPNGDYTVSYAGFENGEDVTALGGALSYVGAAIAATDVGTYVITPQGLTSSNYAITFVNGELSINQAQLTVTADNKTVTYGDAVPALTYTITGFLGTDDISVVTGTANLTTGYTATTAVAASPVTITSAVGDLSAANYSFAFVDGTVTINPKALSITANNQSKTYDGAVFPNGDYTVSYDGFVGAEDVTALGGALSYAGTAIAATHVGTYVITPQGLTSSNYAITFVNGELSINQAALTITATAQNKEYGATLTGTTGYTQFTTSGLQNGETVGSVTVAYANGHTAGATVNTYLDAIALSAATGGTFTPANYAITYESGDLTVTTKTLTITAVDVIKIQGTEYTFDQSAPSINFSVEGLINADAVASVTLASAGSAMGAALGDYAIVVSNAIGTGLGNYSISYTNGTLTVTDKIVLTISDLVVSNKVYDGSVTATVTNWGTLNGIVNGDDVSLDISSATAAFADKEAEVDKSVTLSTIQLQGADAAKYTLTIPVPTASITPRPLVLNTFVADSKSYDGLATVLSGAGFSDDRVGGDALQFAYDVAFENALAGVDKAVEFTNIIINGGADATNYTLATTTGTAQASITPKALVVTANNVSKEYGSILAGATEYANITIVGLIAGETAESVTVQYAGGHSPSAVVGVYADAIEISEITGGTFNVANYSVTYEFGDVTVTAKDITITATPQDKVYGTVLSNAAGYTAFSVTGIANAETVGSVSVNYISGHLGTDATGLYAGAIQISLATGGSFVASNYNITYATGDLTVIAKDLTITANNQSKTYDGAIFPNGDYTVSYAGFENGEDATALGGALSYTGTAMAATHAGTYVITPQGLTSSNYAITFVDGELSINQAVLTITATNGSKIQGTEYTFDQSAPSINFSVEGLINTDAVASVTLASAGSAMGAALGDYAITITNAVGSGLGNYAITYVQGVLSVNDKLVLTIADLVVGNKVYDGSAAATVTDWGSLNGIVNGDDVSLDTTTATATFANKQVQAGKNVTLLNVGLQGAHAAKYELMVPVPTASITPRTLTLHSFEAHSKTYDGLTTVLSGAGFSDDRVPGDALEFAYDVAFENASAGENKAVEYTNIIINGGADASNYTLAATVGTAQASILPKAITVSANNVSKEYGAILASGQGYTDIAITGLLAGDTAQSVTVQYGDGHGPSAAVGVYTNAIEISDIIAVNFDVANYSATYEFGDVTVTPKDLTITATAQNKEYGSALLANSSYTQFALTGIANAETVGSVSVHYSSGHLESDSVGFYENAIVISMATGGSFTPSNYNITYEPGHLTIIPKTLIITANNASKIYGTEYAFAVTAPSNDFTVQGLVALDTVTSVSITSEGSASLAPTGEYAINISNAIGTGLLNYDITYTSGILLVQGELVQPPYLDSDQWKVRVVQYAKQQLQTTTLAFGDTLSVPVHSSVVLQSAIQDPAEEAIYIDWLGVQGKYGIDDNSILRIEYPITQAGLQVFSFAMRSASGAVDTVQLMIHGIANQAPVVTPIKVHAIDDKDQSMRTVPFNGTMAELPAVSRMTVVLDVVDAEKDTWKAKLPQQPIGTHVQQDETEIRVSWVGVDKQDTSLFVQVEDQFGNITEVELKFSYTGTVALANIERGHKPSVAVAQDGYAGMMSLAVKNAGTYRLRLLSIGGEVILTESIWLDAGSHTLMLSDWVDLPSGRYLLFVNNGPEEVRIPMQLIK
jgi:mucin-19